MFLYSTVSTLKPAIGECQRMSAGVIIFVSCAIGRRVAAYGEYAGGESSHRNGIGGGLTDGRDGGNNFTELKLVQDGGLSGSVQTDHQDTHFLATP